MWGIDFSLPFLHCVGPFGCLACEHERRPYRTHVKPTASDYNAFRTGVEDGKGATQKLYRKAIPKGYLFCNVFLHQGDDPKKDIQKR